MNVLLLGALMLYALFLTGCATRNEKIANHASEVSAVLEGVSKNPCLDSPVSCEGYDAIVFVHGIYGGRATFENTKTGFYWPGNIGRVIAGRPVDVFSLEYRNTMVSWAQGKNPSFDSVAFQVKEALKPLRAKKYRSIGFITHSLGGNVISTYMLMLLTNPGHPQRSQVAYVINLATPTYGAQVADMALEMKRTLGMNDYLLESLERENLYLVMLNVFRSEENVKGARNGCRASNLYVAIEGKDTGFIRIVSRDSALGRPDSEEYARQMTENSAAKRVQEFDRNHIEISKPKDKNDEVYIWVSEILDEEFGRLSGWDEAVQSNPPEKRLCEQIPFFDEV